MAYVLCGGCGVEVLDELPRRPCPTCGSTARSFAVGLHESAHAEDRVWALVRTKRLNEVGKVVYDRKAGDDLYRKKDRVVGFLQIVDRENDWYVKKVWDFETGEVHKDVAHRLSEHQSSCPNAANQFGPKS